MTDKKQAWTAEPWEADGTLVVTQNSRLILLDIGGFDTSCEEELWLAEKIAADHNALAGIDDPGEWRRLFDRLRKVSRQYRDESAWSFSATGELHDVIDDILALHPPTEEETGDVHGR